jgi:hypothetical protein
MGGDRLFEPWPFQRTPHGAKKGTTMFDFKDNNWRPFSTQCTQALKVFPNQLWKNSATKEGALVVTKPKEYAEFPINKAGLNHVNDAVKAKRLKQGFVVFVCWQDGTLVVVASKAVNEVLALLAGVEPRTGQWGDYWWVHSDFSPDGKRALSSDEEF